MIEGVPQEDVPVIAPDSLHESGEIRTPKEAAIEAPVLYIPKEMPTDPVEYKRVLESIYAQAGKIVEDRARVKQGKAEYEEFVMMEEASRENTAELARMNAVGNTELGFFSRFGNWIRGKE